MQSVNDFFSILKGRQISIVFIWALFLVSALLDLFGISLIAPYIALIVSGDLIQESRFLSLFVKLTGAQEKMDVASALGLFILLIGIIKCLSGLLTNYFIVRFCNNVRVDLQLALLSDFLNRDYIKFIEMDHSDYVHIMTAVVSDFTKLLKTILQTSADLVIAILLIAFLAWTDLQLLILIVVVSSTTIFLVDRLMRGRLVRTGRLINESNSNIIRCVKETLEGFQEILIFQSKGFFLQKLDANARALARANIQSDFFTELPRYIFELLITSFIVSLIFYSLLTQMPTMSFVSLLGVYGFAAVRLFPLLRGAANAVNQLRLRSHSIAVLKRNLHRNYVNDTSADSTNSSVEPVSFESVSLSNIQFRWDELAEPVLQNVNLSLSKGDRVAIVGGSGVGKTTLLGVLMGFLTPSAGQVRIEGKTRQGTADEKTFLKNFASKVGLVSQNPFVFGDTVLSNVTFTDEPKQANIDLLCSSLEKASASSFVNQLPNGLYSHIGENGRLLSGGQKQRLAIARALYHGKSILIFDEATSALDEKTEEQISHSIELLPKEITVILVTHRRRLLKMCNKVYTLKNGVLISNRKLD